MLSVELHAHSALSHDGRDPVEALLERAEAVGLDGLAVTDHDAIEASLEAERLAPEYGLVGIPGMEVSSAAGHVLALGVRDLVPAGLPFEETVARIRDQGGVAVVPHPFQRSRHGVARRIDRDTLATADAIEVFNSRLLTGIANRRARNFAAARDLPMTAGSDAHIKEMIGRAATDLATDERSVEAVLDAIRDGRTSVTGRRTPWHVSVRQAAGGAKRRVIRRVADLW
ncbi:MAG: CehA/McbA family metallohydrolase [Haloferacaceae archaeon]